MTGLTEYAKQMLTEGLLSAARQNPVFAAQLDKQRQEYIVTENRIQLRRLKIKIKSLAAESKIIRLEERKTKPRIELKEELLHNGDIYRYWTGDYFTLHAHRTYNVRNAAREALLAYGYLRGRAYRQLEQKCYTKPDWKQVVANIKRFSAPIHDNLTPESLRGWSEQEQKAA